MARACSALASGYLPAPPMSEQQTLTTCKSTVCCRLTCNHYTSLYRPIHPLDCVPLSQNAASGQSIVFIDGLLSSYRFFRELLRKQLLNRDPADKAQSQRQSLDSSSSQSLSPQRSASLPIQQASPSASPRLGSRQSSGQSDTARPKRGVLSSGGLSVTAVPFQGSGGSMGRPPLGRGPSLSLSSQSSGSLYTQVSCSPHSEDL